MNSIGFKNDSLEILVSTKMIDNGKFIGKMFKKYLNFNNPVLIINQSKKKINFSNNNFRTIKTDQVGLSNSRNLAIKNSKGKICLFSDDDVIYSSDFIEIIIDAFNERGLTIKKKDEIHKLAEANKSYAHFSW